MAMNVLDQVLRSHEINGAAPDLALNLCMRIAHTDWNGSVSDFLEEAYFSRTKGTHITYDKQTTSGTRETNVKPPTVRQETDMSRVIIANSGKNDNVLFASFETINCLHFDRRGFES